jgi:hypothetical protein
MDRFTDLVAQATVENARQSENAPTASALETSRFEQMLSYEESSDESDVLVNASQVQSAGMGGVMSSAVSKFSAVNQSYKSALEESVKSLSAVDPASPLASVVIMEAAINMSMSEAHMKFASKVAGSSKESLNTLLRSQG